MTSEDVAWWLGRQVKIVDGFDGTIGQEGIILAVDDTPHRPSAWVKVGLDRDYPSYRSCDLCWLQDKETGDDGPTWGTGGPEEDMRRARARISGETA